MSARCFWALGALLLCSNCSLVFGAYTVHTVIPTECKNYFSWQSLGMFYSHRRVGQPGPITRILCCTKDEYERLSEAEKNLVPTHWAPSYTVHPRTGDVYHAYNKPLAVLDWISRNDVKEDFVLVIDADMIMREPFIPEELGAKPGWAVAAFFGYMKGTDNQLALTHVPEVVPRNDTLAGRKGRRGDMAGGFTLMAREDMRRVAPLWLKYTERVREDPGAWNLTGDEWTKKPGDKPWISEMYGYSFGAAKADVWHITHSEHMLYPGYDTMDPPKVLHYGLHWDVKGTSYEFDKHWHFDFEPLVCPPWEMSEDPKKTKKGLFAHPPAPLEFNTTGFDLLRDLLAVEPIIVLNAALCEHHLKHCPPTEELTRECGRAHELEGQLDEAYRKLNLPDPCVNRAKECEWWASVGECEKTAGWMYSHCRPACKWCTPKDDSKGKKKKQKAAEAEAEDGSEADGQQGQQVEEGQGQQQQQEAATGTTGQLNQAQRQEESKAAETGSVTKEDAAQQDGAAGQAAQQQEETEAGGKEDAAAAAGGAGSAQQQGGAAQGEAEGQGEGAAGVQQQQQQDTGAAQVAQGEEGQGEERRAAEVGGGEHVGTGAAAAQGGGGEDAVMDQHVASLAERGGQAKVVQDLSGSGAEDSEAAQAADMVGVQTMVSHHIQMLAVFWGAIMVAVLFKVRRRIFRQRPAHHMHHGRPRLLAH